MVVNKEMINNSKYIKLLSQQDEQMEILLDIICQRLQLDKTKEEKLQSAYNNITTCIEKDDFFDLHEALMYAFGSRAINSVVKPKNREEYDLDFAVQIILPSSKITPKILVNKLYECLNRNGTFKGKLKFIRYGVRVIYSGDFHVDIMLGITTDDNRLFVPDWKDNQWVFRNPKGYIKWFETKYINEFQNIRLYEYYKEYFPEKFERFIQVEERAETEEITPAVTYPEIQPIQRITQLFKRHRDIFFQENMPDYKSSSIIITTLIGDSYFGETSIYEGINKVLRNNLDLIAEHDTTPFKLINPADRNLSIEKQENLTDKWERDLKYYKAFRVYIRKFAKDWSELHSYKSIRERANFLQKMFGENIVKAAYQALNERFKEAGQPFDEKPLIQLEQPRIKAQQVALASMSRGRKPYYNG